MAEHNHHSDRGLRQIWVIGLVILAVATVLGGFVAFAAAVGQPFSFFSKDPAETMNVHRYIGWEAAVGVLVECFGAASALFAGILVRRLTGRGPASSFLLGAGAFTVLLVLDDYLQFHEAVYPFLGIHEIVVYPAYLALIGTVVWLWGRQIVRDDLALVLLAGFFLGVSSGADRFLGAHAWYYHVVEDGSKLMGMTFWTVFLVRTAMRLAYQATRPVAGVPAAVPAEAFPGPTPADVMATVPCAAVTPAALTRAAVTRAAVPVPRTEARVPAHRR